MFGYVRFCSVGYGIRDWAFGEKSCISCPKHWQLPSGKAELKVNPDTNDEYYDPIMVDNGLWNLLQNYGWPGPETEQHYGPLNWTNADKVYHGGLSPFYFLPSGRVTDGSDGLSRIVKTGQSWTNAAFKGSLALYYSVTHDLDSVGVSRGYERYHGLSLRCLTQ